MSRHNIEPGLVTVPVQVFSPAQLFGFIHTNMNLAAPERRACRLQHIHDQSFHRFIADQERPLCIFILRYRLPFQKFLQMRQRLNARKSLDAELVRIIVDFPELGLRIPPPHIAKVRLALDFVGILHIQHDRIQAHQGHFAQHKFEAVHRQHAVAG
ncbi:hypothetical protein D3C76_1097100 [compost metagenome]